MVITIIILLILAGISVSQLLDKNEILNNALNATFEWRKNAIKEKITIEVAGCKPLYGQYNPEEIKEKILEHIEDSFVERNTFPLITTVGEYTFVIDSEGKVFKPNFDYVVEFNGNGVEGTADLQEFAFGEFKSLNSNQYVKDGFTFLNWNTKEDGTGTTYIDGQVVGDITSKEGSVITLYAQWERATASVNGVSYDNLQDALNNIPNDGSETTVTINKDTTENINIKSGQNVVFDLGNNTLNTDTNDAVITNTGTLTITNGTVSSTFATGTINNNEGGTLIVDGGTITGKQRSGIYNDKGTVIISGDSYISSEATGTPNNRTLERGAVHNLAGGTVTITGGTIVGIKQQALTNEGTMIIGSEDNSISMSPVIIGKTYGVKSIGTLKYFDGIIKGITGTISGTISKQLENTQRINTTEKISGKTYNVEYLEFIP